MRQSVLEKKISALEVELHHVKGRGDHVERQLSKLQGEARHGQKNVRVALQKLARSPVVAKRVAAAFHPDKCRVEGSKEAFQRVSKAYTNLKKQYS